MISARWLLVSALVLGHWAGLGIERAAAVPIQGPHGDAAAHAAPEPAVFAPGVISTGDDESHPAFTPDGGTVYFLKNTPDFLHWTVVVSRLEPSGWTTPAVATFSGRYGDADVSFTRDGKTLYFISTRPVAGSDRPQSHTDIWRTHATDGGWGDPERVTELASEGNEWYPTPSADGTLYFGSERRDGNLGREGTADLWRATRVGGRFGEPENLGPTVNTSGNDIEAYVAPDESFLIFASNGRPDTVGAYDLYVTYSCNGAWTEPRHLDVNSAAWDFSPRLSPDGRRLFFTSNRGFGSGPLDRRLDYSQLIDRLHAPGNGLHDIYEVDVAELGIHSPCEGAEH
jgi:Tol biopolymer transport system component